MAQQPLGVEYSYGSTAFGRRNIVMAQQPLGVEYSYGSTAFGRRNIVMAQQPVGVETTGIVPLAVSQVSEGLNGNTTSMSQRTWPTDTCQRLFFFFCRIDPRAWA